MAGGGAEIDRTVAWAKPLPIGPPAIRSFPFCNARAATREEEIIEWNDDETDDWRGGLIGGKGGEESVWGLVVGWMDGSSMQCENATQGSRERREGGGARCAERERNTSVSLRHARGSVKLSNGEKREDTEAEKERVNSGRQRQRPRASPAIRRRAAAAGICITIHK